jgi:hypothetical protein
LYAQCFPGFTPFCAAIGVSPAMCGLAGFRAVESRKYPRRDI